jgi:hypothetical protein
MKKLITLALLAFALPALTACVIEPIGDRGYHPHHCDRRDCW